MEKNNVRRVKIAAAGISDSGGAVRTCVNLTKAAGALVRLDPVPCMPSAEPGEGDGTTTRQPGIIRAAAHYEPVRLTARAIGRMQRQTMPFTPADGDIGAQPPMSARDMASLSMMLADAYCGLAAEAAESGALLQPVPCAYRLVGHDGTTLYESGVEYVGAPEGIQLCEVMHPAVEKRSAKDYTIADFTLSAAAYRLEAVVPAYGSESGVAEVEIYVGEQIHPVDPAATAELRIDRADTADPSLRIALPGATVALTPCQAGLTARAAAKPVAHRDGCA